MGVRGITLRIPELDTQFIFRVRPEAIPGDLRPMWRIAALLVILLTSRAGKTSFGRLHLLNWAIHSRENRQIIRDVLSRRMAPDAVVVRIEPSLNRAVDLARGEGLVDVTGNRVLLTARGKTFAVVIWKHPALLADEKDFLQEVKGLLTEQFVRDLFTGRRRVS